MAQKCPNNFQLLQFWGPKSYNTEPIQVKFGTTKCEAVCFMVKQVASVGCKSRNPQAKAHDTLVCSLLRPMAHDPSSPSKLLVLEISCQ